MKWSPKKTWVVVVSALVVGSGLAYGMGTRHMRQMSGADDVSGAFCTNCHFRGEREFPWQRLRPKHPTPAGLVVSPDGTRLYVACSGTDEVRALDAESGTTLASASVQGTPFGLAVDAQGERLYVTCRDANRLVCLDAASLRVERSVGVGLDPVAVAVVSRPGSSRVVVANAGSGDVSILDANTLEEIARLAAGRQPFALAVAPDAGTILVANRLSAIVPPDAVPQSEATVIDPWHTSVRARVKLDSAHLSEGIAFLPGGGGGGGGGGTTALMPMVMVRNLVPITQVAEGWVMSSGVALLDLTANSVIKLPLDEVNAYFADPSATVVDARGQRAFIASGGADVVTVIDLERMAHWLSNADAQAQHRAADDLQLSSEYVVARIPTGANPRHLALSPDGSRLYVAEHLDDAVRVIDTETHRTLARFNLASHTKLDAARRGARLFFSARTSFQGQFSCRSCHPDGHVDGLAYDFGIDGMGRNILDNRSLRGVGPTPPFKWNGKNVSLHAQCGVRFAMVLTRTDPIAGRDLDDLVAFIESLPPVPPVPKVGEDADAVERGRRLFFATHTPDGRQIPRPQQCSTCHAPPFYTNGLKTKVNEQLPNDSVASFDVPHLIGIAASAPYLHDGRAATLEEIWTVHNPEDTHGITNTYSKHDMNDLVQFLKSL